MARIEIVVCDRCGTTTRRGKNVVPSAQVRITVGDRAIRRDLCVVCEGELEVFLRGVPMQTPQQLQGANEAEEQLAEVRRIANRAIERWGHGAGADELVGVLRDVSSSARRR